MEIRQLRSFLAVAETLNFSRAAQSQFLSQSALSRQILDLEKELAVPLFVRNTRRVELTEAGRLFQEQARDLLDRWEHLGQDLSKDAGGRPPLVHLGIGLDARALSDPRHRLALTEGLYALREICPGLRLQFASREYRELIEALAERTLDFALILDRCQERRAPLEELPLHEEEMVLVFRGSEDEARESVASILDRRHLLMVERETQGMNHIIRILEALSLEPRIYFCPHTRDMTMTMEAGDSAAILPRSVVAKLNNPHLQVLPLPCPQARLQLSLLWNKGTAHPLAPALKDLLFSIFSENKNA